VWYNAKNYCHNMDKNFKKHIEWLLFLMGHYSSWASRNIYRIGEVGVMDRQSCMIHNVPFSCCLVEIRGESSQILPFVGISRMHPVLHCSPCDSCCLLKGGNQTRKVFSPGCRGTPVVVGLAIVFAVVLVFVFELSISFVVVRERKSK